MVVPTETPEHGSRCQLVVSGMSQERMHRSWALEDHPREGATALTAADAGKYVGLFGLPLGRQQAQDRLANDLIGRISEEVLRPPIPSGDGTVEVKAQNGVIR